MATGRLSPEVDQQSARAFAGAWIEVANQAREQHAAQPAAGSTGTTAAQYLGMAAMYLGRALYYATAGDQHEAKAAILRTAAMLYEAWSR